MTGNIPKGHVRGLIQHEAIGRKITCNDPPDLDIAARSDRCIREDILAIQDRQSAILFHSHDRDIRFVDRKGLMIDTQLYHHTVTRSCQVDTVLDGLTGAHVNAGTDPSKIGPFPFLYDWSETR